MANYATLKAAIQQVVKTNGNNEITGALLQQSLLAMIDSLGDGYTYKGIATPSTNPGTPDQNVFYIASQPGIYPNFNGETLTGDVVIFKYNGTWIAEHSGLASAKIVSDIFNVIFGIDETITPEWTSGKYIIENGNIVNGGAALSISDFIPVSDNVTTKVFGIQGRPQINMPSIHFYDSQQQHIGFLYEDGTVDISNTIQSLGAEYVRLSHYETAQYPVAGVKLTKFFEPYFATKEELKNATNFVEPAHVKIAENNYGIIRDGIIYPGNQDYIYTETLNAIVGQQFRLTNVGGVPITWHRVYFYNGNTYVGYKDLGTTINNYTAEQRTQEYNNIRFFFHSSSFSSLQNVKVETDIPENLTSLKQSITELDQRVAAIESENAEESINNINSGSRVATSEDFTQFVNGKFSIEDGKLYGVHLATDPALMMIFNDNIKAIEFEISSLWDSNFISLVFGVGIDAGNSKQCFAKCYLPTSSRPNEIGSVQNADIDGNASNAQSSSIWGQGYFSGEYRQPQFKPAVVSVGSKCRIILIDGHYFSGQIYNEQLGIWDWWFCLDTNGSWNIPNRYGWTVKKAIGFGISFATITTKRELIKNIRVISDSALISSILFELKRNLPVQKQWVAIGDSITEIDKNNGLSYVGYAQRKLGYSVINQGRGGWTIYKLWRDRVTADWENSVSSVQDGDIVTILAGTNDFDTASFVTPASDEAMDAAGNPHPRFGTTDPTSEDAKDPHTTLGCLRLIIERILELKPGVNLIIFAPFYREKGRPIGSTSWEKLYVNSDGRTIYDYAQAITDVAREYNLPSFNTCKDCGINALTLASYTYDDLHISQLGGILIGDYVAKRIRI